LREQGAVQKSVYFPTAVIMGFDEGFLKYCLSPSAAKKNAVFIVQGLPSENRKY
jgi:hypothetical protein